MNNIEDLSNTLFESIKHLDDEGREYWYARELQTVLNYTQWRRFEEVIEKAKTSCNRTQSQVESHFANVGKMVDIGCTGRREVLDYKLSRYACYLIAMNGNPRKKVIALAQNYFAIQTRKQEIMEKDYNSLTEDEKRIYNRELTRRSNYQLNHTAKKAGVKNYDKFHNAGYKGLYNGETADDIARRKGLRYREDILDNMCSDELIANLFRISLTNQKMINDQIQGEKESCITHYDVGKNVRKVIIDNGGTVPEKLPKPNKSLKELDKK